MVSNEYVAVSKKDLEKLRGIVDKSADALRIAGETIDVLIGDAPAPVKRKKRAKKTEQTEEQTPPAEATVQPEAQAVAPTAPVKKVAIAPVKKPVPIPVKAKASGKGNGKMPSQPGAH